MRNTFFRPKTILQQADTFLKRLFCAHSFLALGADGFHGNYHKPATKYETHNELEKLSDDFPQGFNEAESPVRGARLLFFTEPRPILFLAGWGISSSQSSGRMGTCRRVIPGTTSTNVLQASTIDGFVLAQKWL
jgi:hypothetical protein